MGNGREGEGGDIRTVFGIAWWVVREFAACHEVLWRHHMGDRYQRLPEFAAMSLAPLVFVGVLGIDEGARHVGWFCAFMSWLWVVQKVGAREGRKKYGTTANFIGFSHLEWAFPGWRDCRTIGELTGAALVAAAVSLLSPPVALFLVACAVANLVHVSLIQERHERELQLMEDAEREGRHMAEEYQQRRQ